MRPSHLYNGNPYTGETASLYWYGPPEFRMTWTGNFLYLDMLEELIN